MHQALAPQTVAVGRLPSQPSNIVEDEGLALVRRKYLATDPELSALQASQLESPVASLKDVLVAVDDEPHDPDQVFGRLRWGGQFVYVSRDGKEVALLEKRFADRGYAISRGAGFLRRRWGIPLISPKSHFLIVRKTSLIPSREFSDRFTYHVELERREHPVTHGSPALGTDYWVVRKEVPTYERVMSRLQFKAPDVAVQTIERRARKFVDQIFPLFLTRETAMLKIIERDCPPEFIHLFPRVVDFEKDSKGYVHRLWTTWLRDGGKPLSQLEFAKQCAQLLHILHDKIGIIHLDLRMDNMVITNRGLGFVDFGSAVRVDENIHGNAVLSSLFGELMRTSQIQRMMDRMSTTGSLTSGIIRDAYQQVDKSVDIFYLAVQMSHPTANPDLLDLINYDKFSPEAIELSRLTDEILRPTNPDRPKYRSAYDILQEILRIEHKLKADDVPRVVITSGPQPVSPPVPATETPVKPKVWIFNS